MTKKIIGICLIIIGSLTFLIAGYGYKKIKDTPREDMIEDMMFKSASQDYNDSYNDDERRRAIIKGIENMEIVFPIIILVGAGIAFGGFALYRRKKKIA